MTGLYDDNAFINIILNYTQDVTLPAPTGIVNISLNSDILKHALNNATIDMVAHSMLYRLFSREFLTVQAPLNRATILSDILDLIKAELEATLNRDCFTDTFTWINELPDNIKHEFIMGIIKFLNIDEIIGKKIYFDMVKKITWQNTKKAMLYLQIIKLLPPIEDIDPDKINELKTLEQTLNRIYAHRTQQGGAAAAAAAAREPKNFKNCTCTEIMVYLYEQLEIIRKNPPLIDTIFSQILNRIRLCDITEENKIFISNIHYYINQFIVTKINDKRKRNYIDEMNKFSELLNESNITINRPADLKNYVEYPYNKPYTQDDRNNDLQKSVQFVLDNMTLKKLEIETQKNAQKLLLGTSLSHIPSSTSVPSSTYPQSLGASVQLPTLYSLQKTSDSAAAAASLSPRSADTIIPNLPLPSNPSKTGRSDRKQPLTAWDSQMHLGTEAHIELEVERARLELEEKNAEAEQARLKAEQARLKAERARLEADEKARLDKAAEEEAEKAYQARYNAEVAEEEETRRKAAEEAAELTRREEEAAAEKARQAMAKLARQATHQAAKEAEAQAQAQAQAQAEAQARLKAQVEEQAEEIRLIITQPDLQIIRNSVKISDLFKQITTYKQQIQAALDNAQKLLLEMIKPINGLSISKTPTAVDTAFSIITQQYKELKDIFTSILLLTTDYTKQITEEYKSVKENIKSIKENCNTLKNKLDALIALNTGSKFEDYNELIESYKKEYNKLIDSYKKELKESTIIHELVESIKVQIDSIESLQKTVEDQYNEAIEYKKDKETIFGLRMPSSGQLPLGQPPSPPGQPPSLLPDLPLPQPQPNTSGWTPSDVQIQHGPSSSRQPDSGINTIIPSIDVSFPKSSGPRPIFNPPTGPITRTGPITPTGGSHPTFKPVGYPNVLKTGSYDSKRSKYLKYKQKYLLLKNMIFKI